MRARAAPPALTIRAVPVILVAGLITASHAHVAHPWCTSGRGWGPRVENARLYTANCVANPAIDRSRRSNRAPLGRIGADAGVRPLHCAAAQGAPALRAMQAR